MNRITKSFTYSEYDDSAELTPEEQDIIRISFKAAQFAYAPYSGFYVGAAVLLDNGNVIKGNNQENAAYPSGLCAERVAVYSASALYPQIAIKAIAISSSSKEITAGKFVTPCGSCRQALIEYEKKQKSPIKLLLSGQKGKIITINSISDLLPLHFNYVNLIK